MAKSSETPLMKQYNEIKSRYPDTILLFRLGDFYETFEDDAVLTARVCGITLTKRNNGAAGDLPLAGFPHHQLDVYLPKLVKAGNRVAVCEQLEDPKNAKGIVKRGVTEVVTPGVSLNDKLLDTGKNNFVCSIYRYTKLNVPLIAISFCDISTGDFISSEVTSKHFTDFLETYSPSEIIISKEQFRDFESEINKLSFSPYIVKREDWIFDYDYSLDLILKQYELKTLKGFGFEDEVGMTISSGALLSYLKETQQSEKIVHLKNLKKLNSSDFMMLDYPTRRNLEITFSSNSFAKEGSLYSILDSTQTPMGSRLLKQWISRPLIQIEEIQKRLDAVGELNSENKFTFFRDVLKNFGDLERLIAKVASRKANAREFVAIKYALKKIQPIKEYLKEFNSEYLKHINENLFHSHEIVLELEKAILDDPSTVLGSGNIFKKGFSSTLDEYIEAKFNGKNWVNEYQKQERERTNISSLKVGYTSVFGYYIEISKVNVDKVPPDYHRKQTLTNAERYTTPELTSIETKILSAEEQILIIESRLLSELIDFVAKFTSEIQNTSYNIASIDCLCSFAFNAINNKYVKPIIDESNNLEITNGRHPVVEKILPLGEAFKSNSSMLNEDEGMIHLITGPNMAGKSCYLRQVGLIVLMAQCGSFVPADSALIGVVDRIFTRVGAQDNMQGGESTFLVEMQESANIMNNASEKSLILLDEVGRGTATFDGISIAWSIVEYIANQLKSKTLFATHYHELTELENKYPSIRNYKVEVIENDDKIIFTHKLVKGFSNHSFGIHVANMAGLPKDLVLRAYDILELFESRNIELKNKIKSNLDKLKSKKEDTFQMSFFSVKDDIIREKLKSFELTNVTPFNALQILYELQTMAKNEL